ncbi:MAG: alkaline phosphatase PhoX [Pseudomonadota bacterium]
MSQKTSRRQFLQQTLNSTGYIALGTNISSMSAFANGELASIIASYGTLQSADANGVRLPSGFRSRIVATSGRRVSNSNYIWHRSPDGGACFPTSSGGWIYTSNCEESRRNGGGASAIYFDASGNITGARSILTNTDRNCAGGATPWYTWLSCEEVDRGAVWETDPYGYYDAVERKALGYFKHEAAAVDPFNEIIYMTEDERDGCLYRFIPSSGLPSRFNSSRLESGRLEVALLNGSSVSWREVPTPNPSSSSTRTRYQVSDAYQFNGGEGIWYDNGYVFFATKGDNRIWALDTQTQIMYLVYDARTSNNPILTGVDNITVSSTGDIVVAEDGGDMQIVILDYSGNPTPLLQISGQSGSEIAGPAFSPDGNRLYFSSQRGYSSRSRYGITYEITGPFRG